MNKLNILIFGGSGFIGSHVADTLSRYGHKVSIFDIKNFPSSKTNHEMIIGDILDNDLIDQHIKGKDVIYNFAGIADIDECHKRPVDTIKYNILGNAQILQSAVNNNVNRYLFASSAYVYSSSGSFYRISKQTSEQFIESLAKDKSLDYTILRYGSLYGDRADKRNSLYKILHSAVTTKKINYFGDGSETREFIHVKDAAKLSVEALDNEYKNQILMLTGTKSIRYSDLLKMVKEILNNEVEIIMHPNQSNTHYKMSPYSFNPKMAKKLISNPHIDLGQGLLNLIADIHRDSNPNLDDNYKFISEKK